MKGIAITHRGIEDICAKEIDELINAKSEIKETVCIFSVKKLEDLALLCYKAQSVIKILYLLDSFQFKNLEDIKKRITKMDFSGWVKSKKFKIECERIGSHDFSSVDIHPLGKQIKGKMDFRDYEVIIYFYIYNNSCYAGIDFSGFDLSKRDYKIFVNPRDIKGTIAYSLIRIADYKKGEVLFDPFCNAGTIAIEAALFKSNFPINYYRKDKFIFLKIEKLKNFNFEKINKNMKSNKKIDIYGFDHLLKNIKAAQKNAKIAGIQKQIKFSRVDVEWIELKLKKESVDKIVTYPPIITEANKKTMEKLYNELFYQCNFILKKAGKVALITKNRSQVKEIAFKNKLRIKEERAIGNGKEELCVLVLNKAD